jgi:cyclic pyranopterin phosphate synthase
MSPAPELLLATNNAHKVEELRALFAGCDWALRTPAELGISTQPEESGDSYEENARLKALAFAAASGRWSLADDSGLEVDALDGAPGLHSARYAGAETPHADKIRVLLEAMAASGDPRRSARFRAVFVVAAPDGRTWTAEGVWEGTIADAPRGAAGFGYDPIFIGVEDGRTAAELDAAEKNAVSHRARAAAVMLPILRGLVVEAAGTPSLSHVDAAGRARMVDVSEKRDSQRTAVARGRVTMRPETLALIERGEVAKGNVLTTAQIAGVMAAKRTHELIPMCHPLLLTGINVDLTPDREASAIEIAATVRTTGKTGVEMEALSAVAVAALTVYDMCKAVDRGMRIEAVRLVEKHGGKSGDIVLE